jgi:hypothetical protein
LRFAITDDRGVRDVRLPSHRFNLGGDTVSKLSELVIARLDVRIWNSDGDDWLLEIGLTPPDGSEVRSGARHLQG